MRKKVTVLLLTLTMLMPLLLSAGSQNVLKMRVLSDTSLPEIKVLIFRSSIDTLPGYDSLDLISRKIFHFSLTTIAVDYLLDTISIASQYFRYDSKILEAYQRPNQEVLVINSSKKTTKSLWGLRIHETWYVDTVFLCYEPISHEIKTSHQSGLSTKSYAKLELLLAIIMLFYYFIDYEFRWFFYKLLRRKESEASKFFEYLTAFLILIFVVSLVVLGIGPWKVSVSFLVLILLLSWLFSVIKQIKSTTPSV